MTRGVVGHAARIRYLSYLVLCTVFTLLMTVVTVRFALEGGETFETLLLAALTLGIAFQTRRWYRRFRMLSNGGAPLTD